MGDQNTFESAAAAGIITRDQAARLAAFYRAAPFPPAAQAQAGGLTFDITHVLWYAGALIVIGAMTLFTTLAFVQLGGGALLFIALVYAFVFAAAGHYLWHAKGLTTPGGLLIVIAVAMTPLAVFGLQAMMGWWGDEAKPGDYHDFYVWVKSGWLPMELVTLFAALVAVFFYPFGFITMVAAVALWFMSMDLTPLIAGQDDYSWALRAKVSMWFGLCAMVFAWVVDLAQRRADYAFWLHFAGVLAFWGGLTSQHSDSELNKFLYLLINIALIFFAVFLSRRIYAVFGAIGVCLYVGDLAERVFRDSLLFPFALSLIGIGVIGLGLWYHRNRAAIEAAVERAMPDGLKRLRP